MPRGKASQSNGRELQVHVRATSGVESSISCCRLVWVVPRLCSNNLTITVSDVYQPLVREGGQRTVWGAQVTPQAVSSGATGHPAATGACRCRDQKPCAAGTTGMRTINGSPKKSYQPAVEALVSQQIPILVRSLPINSACFSALHTQPTLFG